MLTSRLTVYAFAFVAKVVDLFMKCCKYGMKMVYVTLLSKTSIFQFHFCYCKSASCHQQWNAGSNILLQQTTPSVTGGGAGTVWTIKWLENVVGVTWSKSVKLNFVFFSFFLLQNHLLCIERDIKLNKFAHHYERQMCRIQCFVVQLCLCSVLIFFSFVVKSEPIDLLNVAFEQQHNSNVRYPREFL